RIHAPELRVREQEYYRAVYCGLCRTMGKCTGQCSRMTLSYDFTYFALVRMALTGKYPAVKPRRCLAHPTRRRPMAEPTEDLALCAYMSAILAYHKVRDDLRDEKCMKRTLATAVAPFAGSIRRRALKRGYGEADLRVASAMQALCDLEATRPPSVDEPASLFGELMATLLGYGLTGNAAKLAHTIGYHVGRWVYILDAADDFAEDVKAKRYNPLACLYGDPAMTELPERKRQELKTALLAELLELERAFDLLDTADNPNLGGVLANILYEGMPREAEHVLFAADADRPRTENTTER
ncbi:MAG: hypothetical protein IJX72_06975, partial [Clostridia bacterium]|nr:hypothetical protein [Clostridia bacterium]